MSSSLVYSSIILLAALGTITVTTISIIQSFRSLEPSKRHKFKELLSFFVVSLGKVVVIFSIAFTSAHLFEKLMPGTIQAQWAAEAIILGPNGQNRNSPFKPKTVKVSYPSGTKVIEAHCTTPITNRIRPEDPKATIDEENNSVSCAMDHYKDDGYRILIARVCYSRYFSLKCSKDSGFIFP